jgi:ubiquinone/menaquinone biosynthesis C-methylase UbiE
MVTMHVTGATAFDGIERAYERTRPGYAMQAILTALLLAGAGDLGDVADVAAGTGKLTRLIAPHASSLVAIEPSAPMRAAFALAQPEIEIRDGHAEDLPLGDASLDLVTVGEAFHWFRPTPALAEIARVLRPGGALVIASNDWRVDAAPWLREVFAGPVAGQRVRRPGRSWRRTLERSPLFEPYCEAAQPHEVTLTHADFLDLIRSQSRVNAMEPDVREAHVADVQSRLAAAAPDPLAMPFRTRAVAARRV